MHTYTHTQTHKHAHTQVHMYASRRTLSHTHKNTHFFESSTSREVGIMVFFVFFGNLQKKNSSSSLTVKYESLFSPYFPSKNHAGFLWQPLIPALCFTAPVMKLKNKPFIASQNIPSTTFPPFSFAA